LQKYCPLFRLECIYNNVSFYNINFYKTKETKLTKICIIFSLVLSYINKNIKHGEEFIGKAREVYIYKYLIDYYKKKLHRIKHLIDKD
jgi:hypothetical protein